MAENIKSILKNLCTIGGVAGNETDIGAYIAALLKKHTEDVTVDGENNVCAVFGNKDADYHIMLDAHIDRIGFIVSHIDDTGLIRFKNSGGVDTRILVGQRVKLIGKKAFTGIIRKEPDCKVAADIDSLFIETMLSGDDVKEQITVGDIIYFESTPCDLLNNSVAAASLDNRAGAGVLIYLANLISKLNYSFKISLVFTAQEEIGEIGARHKAYELAPNEAIVVDTTFAKQEGFLSEGVSYIALGTALGIAPNLSNDVVTCFKGLAKKYKMPLQFEVMGGTTGTDSDVISESRSGVKTSLLSVPIKYMHSPFELCSVTDIENTALLIFEYLAEKEGQLNAKLH